MLRDLRVGRCEALLHSRLHQVGAWRVLCVPDARLSSMATSARGPLP